MITFLPRRAFPPSRRLSSLDISISIPSVSKEKEKNDLSSPPGEYEKLVRNNGRTLTRAINPWRVFAGRNTCWRNPRRIYVAHINRRGTCELLIAMRYVIGERRSLLRVNAARRCVRELGVRSLRFRWRKRGSARV